MHTYQSDEIYVLGVALTQRGHPQKFWYSVADVYYNFLLEAFGGTGHGFFFSSRRRHTIFKCDWSSDVCSSDLLGVDATLDRVAAQPVAIHHERQRRARGDRDLLLHEIEVRAHLGHRVLDLDARVHLHKVEGAVRVEQELDRPRPYIADRLRQLHRCVADVLAQRLVHYGRRRLLHELLVAALHRAVALAQMHHLAVGVAHDLDLDMARTRQVLLDVDLVGVEGGERFLFRERKGLRELLRVVGDTHPLAAAARRGLDDDRETDFLRDALAFLEGLDGPRRPGHRRHTLRLGERARGRLVAHLPDLVGRRADERDVGRADFLGELRVFREEAVAGMDGVGAGDFGGRDEPGDVEVAVAAGRAADADVVVGETDVQRLSVRFRIHRHRLDPQLLARADHPQGNLPAVRDQHFLEH